MPGESYGSIDALYGSDCANGGCTLLVGDFNTTAYALTEVEEPAVELATSEPLRVAAVSPDGTRWAVTYASDEDPQFGCSGIYDPTAEEMLARSCDATVWSFSPDGRRLVSARGDNQMWSSVEVLDETLDVVLSYEPADGQVVKGWGWDDADHLLVEVASLGAAAQWSVVRVPVDGSEPEVVQGPVPGPDAESASVFVISE